MMIPLILQKLGFAPWVSVAIVLAVVVFRMWRSREAAKTAPIFVLRNGSPAEPPAAKNPLQMWWSGSG